MVFKFAELLAVGKVLHFEILNCSIVKRMDFADLFSVVFHPERMQCEPRDLENPAIVHVTVGAGQVTVRLEHRLVQVDHSLST